MSDASGHALRPSLWASAVTVFASSATLICCALPALLVTLGAGAALAGLVGAFPGLIWLSLHKAWVFAVAGLMLAVAGVMQWRSRRLPCPLDPGAAAACMRMRRWSAGLYGLSVIMYGIGGLFAFVLPQLM